MASGTMTGAEPTAIDDDDNDDQELFASLTQHSQIFGIRR